MINKRVIAYAIGFLSGAAAGSVTAWMLLKTKYEKIAQEEIDSVKEKYSIRKPAIDVEEESEIEESESINYVETKDGYFETTENENANLKNYHTIIEDNGYVSPKYQVDEDGNLEPYVITPDEFGESYDFETETLYYYADGVLTDDQDIIIEDIEALVGIDFASHYGEYEEDCVYVRNERLKTDYEILSDIRGFDQVMSETKCPEE